MSGRDFETVFLARHGQTEWNRLRRRQGQLDSPLTPEGLDQARQVAATVAGLPIDAVFSSPLGRAKATGELCAQALGMAVIIIELLAEVHHGRMAGMTSAEINEAFPGEMAFRAANKYEWRFPEGESYAEADRRAAVALGQIASYGVRRPLLVSHEMVGRMLIRNLLRADPVKALTWSHRHDVVLQVDVANHTLSELRVNSMSEGTGEPGNGRH